MPILSQRLDELQQRKHVSGRELSALVAEMLMATGMSSQFAAQASELLVECQRRGIESHGVAHLPVYLRRMMTGAIDPRAIPVVVSSNGATCVLDGMNALGVVVAEAAMMQACRLAKRSGIGACAVRNSNHFGAAAPLVDRAAHDGLVAMAFSNAAPTMAPWGGREALLGTNPLALAFPRAGGHDPVVVDMATSVVARGRVRQAALKNEVIPDNWALDASGLPTTDPVAALAGTIQPLGGAKGYALTLAVELLCTALSGGRAGFEVLNPHDTRADAAGVSHLFIAFDPAFFAGREAAEAAVDELDTRIQASDVAVAGRAPRLPGTRASAIARERDDSGIPLTPHLMSQLRNAAGELSGRDAST